MSQIPTVAVIGGGVLGRGIAHAAALAGYQTILEDILPSSLRKSEGEFQAFLGNASGTNMVSPEAATAALQRLHYADSVEEAARNANLIIEAVPEEMESKLEIFTLLDKVSRPGTIFVCSTSIFTVAEIASVTYRPQLCVGMRFSHPVAQMAELEIVRTPTTSDAAFTAARDLGLHMGKQVILIDESKIYS